MVDDLLVSFQLVHPFIMTYRPTIIQTDRNQSRTVVINCFPHANARCTLYFSFFSMPGPRPHGPAVSNFHFTHGPLMSAQRPV